MRIRVVLLTAWLCACSAMPSRSPPAPASPLPGQPLGPGVSWLPGRFVPGEQPDGNTVLLRGKDGLIVVDTGRHAAHTARIVDAASAAGRPVAAIVNTHWHLDHVAGNAALRAAYPQAPVLASDAIDAALHGFLADYRGQLQGLVAQPPPGASAQALAGWREEIARIEAGDRLAPTRVIARPQTLALAGRRVRLGLERNAVSGGDVWLFDPASRVLVAGDLVTLPVPLFDTACAAGWQAALRRLEAVPFVQLVPGHGAPMDRAGFATYRQAFDRLLACAAGPASDASCKAGWLHDAGPLLPAGDRVLAEGLLDYYLPQVLRATGARRDKYCHKEPTQ